MLRMEVDSSRKRFSGKEGNAGEERWMKRVDRILGKRGESREEEGGGKK